MSHRKRISILAMILAVACEILCLANQAASNQKSESQREQSAPVDYIAPEELKAKIANNQPVSIVDLRGPSVYARAEKTIVGAVHAKVRRVVYRLREFPRDREVVTYCACPADEAAIIGARALLANGFKRVRVLKGGWNAWLEAGGQLRPRPR